MPDAARASVRLHAGDATTPGHLHLPGERHGSAADSAATGPARERLRAPCTCGCGDGAPPAAGGFASPLACAPPAATLRRAVAPLSPDALVASPPAPAREPPDPVPRPLSA